MATLVDYTCKSFIKLTPGDSQTIFARKERLMQKKKEEEEKDIRRNLCTIVSVINICVTFLVTLISGVDLYFSLKTSFVYSNLFSLAKTVTICCFIQTNKRERSSTFKRVQEGARSCLKLQSINYFTIAACGNVIEFHSVLLFIDPSRLILMSVAKCRGSWVVGRGRGWWVWVVGRGCGCG